MDEAENKTSRGDASCRDLNSLFDLCARKNIDAMRVLRGVPWPMDHLQDPTRFIDWASYAAIVSNFSKYLSEEELLEAGRRSWKQSYMGTTGRLLYRLKDHFLQTFGSPGTIASLYPCRMSLFEVSPGHVTIILQMHDGCPPCHTFHLLIAGEMMGLPESSGYPRPLVQMIPNHRGATYNVQFAAATALFAPLRGVLTWLFTARHAARELAITSTALLEKSRQLHEATTKLKVAKDRLAMNEEKYRLLTTDAIQKLTERRVIEQQLQDLRESYRVIVHSAPDAIITVDQHNCIRRANPSTSRHFGYEISELIGVKVTDLVPGLNLGTCLPMAETAKSGISLSGRRKDGSYIPLEISLAGHQTGDELRITVIIRDMSYRTRVEEERKELEQQLMASQKRDTIGQLTGGVAHDFNNLLVAIIGYTELALHKRSEPASLTNFLIEIKQAGQRAADMTRKLLAFSRQQVNEPAELNLNDVIDGLGVMIKRLLPENIDIRLSSTDENLIVMADKGQLEQVIINLAVNARDSMPRGGRLHISSERVMLDNSFSNDKPVADTVDYVLIRVSDTGSGMSEEIRNRVFEPFFTTKPEGAGTGLGLAVVLEIVQQHDGFIDIQSEPEQGSSIKIYLPLTSKPRPVTAPARRKLTMPARGGNETLLVVEDNNQVRELARLILRGAGYKVLVCSNGQEALNIFTRNSTLIDLVILDVVMPRISGREVMIKLQEVRPDIKIMFTSGYSENGDHASFIREEKLEFVKKPYGTEDLRSRVRKVLDQPCADRTPSTMPDSS